MSRLYINNTLEKSIRSYCELNDIEDVNAFANRCAMQGFNIIKFGISPRDNIERENNGIKDIDKNDKRQIKQEFVGENRGKQESKQQEEGGKENNKEKEGKPTQERKENITVRKIKIIKK